MSVVRMVDEALQRLVETIVEEDLDEQGQNPHEAISSWLEKVRVHLDTLEKSVAALHHGGGREVARELEELRASICMSTGDLTRIVRSLLQGQRSGFPTAVSAKQPRAGWSSSGTLPQIKRETH